MRIENLCSPARDWTQDLAVKDPSHGWNTREVPCFSFPEADMHMGFTARVTHWHVHDLVSLCEWGRLQRQRRNRGWWGLGQMEKLMFCLQWIWLILVVWERGAQCYRASTLSKKKVSIHSFRWNLLIFVSFFFFGYTLPQGMWDLRILVPWPGIEPAPLTLEVWSLNPWTSRKVEICWFLNYNTKFKFTLSLPGSPLPPSYMGQITHSYELDLTFFFFK